jgi:hypothetical protein
VTRYIVGTLLLAGFCYWGYSSWTNHVASEKARIVREARRDALKASVTQMASKVNAVTDWAVSLAGGNRTRNSLVLTAELQELWVIRRPILFVGNVEDIALSQDGTYQVIVEYNWRYQPRLAESNIRIAFDCHASAVMPLIKPLKEQRKPILSPDIAITGHIQRIVTTFQKDSEGETIKILTGVGQCLDAMYLDERISY